MGLLGGYAETDAERAAIEQRDQMYMEAERDAAEWNAARNRIAELEAALGSLWDTAVTIHHDGDRGCFVNEAAWRKAMSALHVET